MGCSIAASTQTSPTPAKAARSGPLRSIKVLVDLWAVSKLARTKPATSKHSAQRTSDLCLEQRHRCRVEAATAPALRLKPLAQHVLPPACPIVAKATSRRVRGFSLNGAYYWTLAWLSACLRPGIQRPRSRRRDLAWHGEVVTRHPQPQRPPPRAREAPDSENLAVIDSDPASRTRGKPKLDCFPQRTGLHQLAPGSRPEVLSAASWPSPPAAQRPTRCSSARRSTTP
jgi:hypothetical protein